MRRRRGGEEGEEVEGEEVEDEKEEGWRGGGGTRYIRRNIIESTHSMIKVFISKNVQLSLKCTGEVFC